jgi:HPt (histidine-containing phosphotransfer) domain-containing protein
LDWLVARRIHGHDQDLSILPSDAMAEINRAVLQEIRVMGKDRGAEMLAKIVGLFLSESPQLIQKIQDAIIKADAKSLRQGAHYLRSGALGIGATRVAEICWQLEHAAEKQLDDASVKKLFVELRARWQAAADELGDEAFD